MRVTAQLDDPEPHFRPRTAGPFQPDHHLKLNRPQLKAQILAFRRGACPVKFQAKLTDNLGKLDQLPLLSASAPRL